MTTVFNRSIQFMIPKLGKSPEVQVKATEVDGNIFFEIEILSDKPGQPHDLRGLFFNLNSSFDDSLSYVDGDDITNFDTQNAINFKNGTNLKGKNKDSNETNYDVGINFGTAGVGRDTIESTTFTLSSDVELSLDDIANVQFAARINGSKLTVEAPAAPDAIDDEYEIFEDGQTGLDSPSHEPISTVFQVLSNDTDADGDLLTITDLHQPNHGTVEIIDGDDDDDLIGDAILYTPLADYSGEDSFEYLISDNNGGTDFASVDVNIVAVADIPGLEVTARATENVNEIIYTVTGIQKDLDNSEFISSITATGGSGVTINEYSTFTTSPDGNAVKEFLISLPYAQNLDSNITFEITSTESSNDDTETYSEILSIKTFYEEYTGTAILNDTKTNFAPVESYTSFDGVDEGEEVSEDLGGGVSARLEASIKAGIDTVYNFESGDLIVETSHETGMNNYYNQVTDILQIDTSSTQLSATWDIVDAFFSAKLEAEFDLTIYAGLDTDIGDFNLVDLLATMTFPPLALANNIDIVDFQFGILDPRYVEDIPFYGFIDLNENGIFDDDNESRELNIFGEIEEIGEEQTLPWKADFLSATYNSLDDGDYSGSNGHTITEEINIIDYTFDIDEFIWNIVETFVNPIEIALGPTATTAQKLSAKAGAVASQLNLNPLNLEFEAPFVGPYFDIELLDFDLGINYFVERESSLVVDSLIGIAKFEDGSNKAFTLGDSFQVDNVTAIDSGGNNDGHLDYDVYVTTNTHFDYQMTLDKGGFFEVDALKLEGGLTLNDPTGITEEVVSWFTDDDFSASIQIPFGTFDGIELVNETLDRTQVADFGELEITLTGNSEFNNLGVDLA